MDAQHFKETHPEREDTVHGIAGKIPEKFKITASVTDKL
jgi:hypothetical protein